MDVPPTGKLSPEAFDALIAPYLGAARDDVLLGPRPGCDVAIVRIGAGRVMAATADPLSLIPALGPERSARLACGLVASDLWTSGIAPSYAVVSLHLPPALDDATLGAFTRAMGEEWARLGVAVVGGHTGRYDGCDLTIVGAATLFGVGDESAWIAPSMARPGDAILVTKSAAFEATAIAARMFPDRLLGELRALAPAGGAEAALEKARGWIEEVSVVADCRAALRAGVRERGVTALHDATEGGVLGGLLELAVACGHEARVDRAALPVAPEAVAARRAFGIDPLWTLSEGTLIACVRPEREAAVLAELARDGIVATNVGAIAQGDPILRLREADGSVTAIARPEPDPYWPAYARAVREGWR